MQSQPKNLPVAIVNEDQGLDIPNQPRINMGKNIDQTIQKTSTTDDESAIKWKMLGELQKDLDN